MASACSITKKYTMKKINVVRWKPPASNFTKPEIFVSGSWDDENNTVAVWKCNEEGDPTEIQEIPVTGDVTDISYLNRELLAFSSHYGTIALYQHKDNDKLEKLQSWENCHSIFPGSNSSCTALANNGSVLASVGEDAKLQIHIPGEKEACRTIYSGTDCSDYAVCFTKASQILTGNMQGQLRLWDIRKKENLPVMTLVSNDQDYVCHLSAHPSQQHVVVAAGEAGTLTLWDMRDTSAPFSCISAHSAPMSECKFHPSVPDHLFSCGLDGQLVHWDASDSTNMRKYSDGNKLGGDVTSWLHPGIKSGELNTTAVISTMNALPLNSLDVQADTLLAASDNEAIYIVRNVILF